MEVPEVLGKPNSITKNSQKRIGQHNLLHLLKNPEFNKLKIQEMTFSQLQPKKKVAYMENLNKDDIVNSYYINRDGQNSIQELFTMDDYVIALTQHGVCFTYEKYGGETIVLNLNEREKIRSIFLNNLNDSIFIVSVKEKQDCSKMKCRSLPIRDLKKGEIKGQKLFTNFVLKWPDFIEFDELNSKIVTKHTEESAYRVWSLESYQLLYVLNHEYLAEFKICNGVMLLLFNPVNNSIPMTIVNVHTGNPIMNIAYQGQLKDIEFVEQFNEQILIKQKQKPLKIHNILTNQSKLIHEFQSPDAFIFIYEKEIFVSLQQGKITMWSTDGTMISNFDKEILYSQSRKQGSQDRNYVISLSNSRKYLFTVIKENQLEPDQIQSRMQASQNQTQPSNQSVPHDNSQEEQKQAPPSSSHSHQASTLPKANQSRVQTPLQMKNYTKSNNVEINVVDIQKGKLIGKIQPNLNSSKYQGSGALIQAYKLEKLLNQITFVYYDEQRHEIITGHQNGLLSVTTSFAQSTVPKAERKLKLREDGTFTMIQLTDIHYGEQENWDQQNDEIITKMLQTENPDFTVVTGDVVSGYAWDGFTKGWFGQIYDRFAKVLTKSGIPWALTAGNHDTQADLTREEVSVFDRQYEMSMTKPNAAQITHSFNYVIPVYDSKGENVVFRMWFLDSGEEGCMDVEGYDCIRPDQIEWFRQENRKIAETDPSKGKGFLFVHIPIYEYVDLYNNNQIYGKRGEDICCQALNTGLFAAMKEQKTVEWVSAGHDHDNDYYGVHDGINLAYGRKTGYGCYGPSGMLHGGRVFKVSTVPEYKTETYVRQEDGTVHTEASSQNARIQSGDPSQSICGGAAGKAKLIDPHDVELAYLRQWYLKREDLKHLVPQ